MPGRSGSPRRIHAFALAAVLAFSTAFAVSSTAAEESQDNTAPADTLHGTAAAAEQVVVDTHAYLERSMLDRVVWFDKFFGSVKAEETRPPGYLLRWRNSFRWEEGGGFKYRTSIRANLRLPKIGERARLVISGEDEAEPNQGLPEEPGNPGFDQTLQNTRLVNAELRYGVLETPTTNLFLGGGFRLVLPVETFVRVRGQHIVRLGADSLARLGETLFWKDVDGFGETTEIGLERRLAPRTLLRWANSATVSQISKGLDWGTELSGLHELSPTSGITLAGGLSGNTEGSWVENYRTYLRYRRNFLTQWLFFELEPEISWPRRSGGGYPATHAFTFRLELVFQGSASVSVEQSGAR